jgi:hypothetical protein
VAQSGDLVGQATWSKGAKVLELVISTPVK